MWISKNSPMSQATLVNMLNGSMDIFINVASIKFQFSINKVLHNISNQACLQQKMRKIILKNQVLCLSSKRYKRFPKRSTNPKQMQYHTPSKLYLSIYLYTGFHPIYSSMYFIRFFFLWTLVVWNICKVGSNG